MTAWELFPRKGGGYVIMNRRKRRAIICDNGNDAEFFEYDTLPPILQKLKNGFPIPKETLDRVLLDHGFIRWIKR